MPNRSHHQINRLSWNEGTKAHNSHKGDQAAFFRRGGNTLFPEETGLLGHVAGNSLLHLQCNCGQDSLSIANHLGAAVTGVDISDEAIRFARELSRDSGIAAEFVRADIYDYFEENETQFDVVFSSYGAMCWLSDIESWGRGVSGCLRPGGRFVLIEFHPAFAMFDEEWKLRYDYLGGIFYEFESGIGDYVALTGAAAETEELEPGIEDFVNPFPGVEYQWGLAEVAMCLVSAGLSLVDLREYSFFNGFKPMGDMRELGLRRYVMPERLPQSFPLMYSIVVQKP